MCVAAPSRCRRRPPAWQRCRSSARRFTASGSRRTTIRAVAVGVVGVGCIQAITVGLSLLVAGVPWAGVLAGIVLVLAIAQIPAAIVILPAIAYLWLSGNYSNGAAIGYTVLLLVAG